MLLNYESKAKSLGLKKIFWLNDKKSGYIKVVFRGKT